MNSSKSQELNSRTAMLCWSNLQLINCLNYAYHSSEKIDLFVQNGLDKTGNLIKKIRISNLFSNVFVYDASHWHYSKIQVIIKTLTDYIQKNSFHSFIKDNLRAKTDFLQLYFMTQNYIKTSNMIVDGDYSSETRQYTKVLSPWPDELTFQLLISNKNSELILYEDGIGSYSIDMFGIKINTDIKKGCQRLNIDINDFRPSRIILTSNTDPAARNYSIEHLKPIIKNNDLFQLLYDIFDYKDNYAYNKKHIIYLTQPFATDFNLNNNSAENIENKESEILYILSNYNDNLIIRPHPRDKERMKSLLNAYEVDMNQNVWELICANELTDNHILIGACSTAQFTPKWWFDIEPWVIITYSLQISDYDFYNNNYLENARRLKSSYRNPEKIILVDTIDELKSALEEIINI